MASDTRLTLSYDVENCSTPTYHAYADMNFVMIFTANEGYQFVVGDTANNLEYADSSKWIPDSSRYVTNDGIVNQVRMITKMLDYPTSAVMHVKAYEIISENIPVTQNLTNCTSSFTDTTIQPSSSATFTLTANTNYRFTDTPSYTINSNTFNFTRISDSVYSAEITAPATGTIVINATASEINMIPITQNLVNCTSSLTDNSVIANAQVSITLTPYTYCTFPDSSATYSINNETFYFIHHSSYVQAEFTAPSTGTIVVNATANDTRNTVDYTLSNCSVTPVISRIDYSSSTTFTAKANDGYKFDSAKPPYYTLKTGDRYYFTKVNDYTYTLNSDDIPYKQDLHIYATALQEITPPKPTDEISYGFLNIYLPSMETLKNLSQYRFFNSDMENVNCFQYIYKVHKMYFNIPVEDLTYITLAKYRTNLTSYCTSNAFVSTNCGSVTIPELYHNIFDYQHTTARIYLPLIGYQSIDTTNIMNSTVNLEYRANIVTGKVIAIVSTNERGNLYQFEGYGGFDIPYMLNNFENGVNHDLYQSSAYLGDFTPSLQLFTNIPYGNDNNPFGYSVSQWTKIGDCTGYIRCEDIQLVITQNYITNSEMNMIMDLLKDGIFIS